LKRHVKTSVSRKSAGRSLISITGKCSILFVTAIGMSTILISGYVDDRIRARALADGIICYLTKPCDEDTLFGCVSSALERAKPDEYRS